MFKIIFVTIRFISNSILNLIYLFKQVHARETKELRDILSVEGALDLPALREVFIYIIHT